MANLKIYSVRGSFEGKSFNETIQAYSSKQAKLRAGFEKGIAPNDISRYMKSRNIKVIIKRR